MLNLKRFQNNFKVTMQGGCKTVHEWNSEEGEGCYINSFCLDNYNGSFDLNINDVKIIGKKILEHINACNYTDFKESDLTIIDNRITWNQIEDNDCNILETIEEEEEADKCYICDYDIFVSINGVDLTEEELREVLPKAN